MRISSLHALTGTVLLLAGSMQAAEKVTYDDHVFPIFESTCLNCHNPDKKKGDLDLSNYTGTMAGGSGGAIASAGDGGGSKLYASITHTAEPVMPPRGEKLSKKDTDLIRAWIDGGLLENKSSKAKKPSGPKIAKLDIDPTAKPEEPPPMPENLNLEPAVTSSRNTVVNDMACSPWAPLLAVTGQKQILLYNTDTLRLAAILPFPKGFPESVSFHPTGKYLIAGGGIAGKSGTTYTWDITTGKLLMQNGREFDSVLGASLRLDLGGVALGGPSRLIKLWDTQSGEEIKSIKKHTDWVTTVGYSPDGVLLATGDRNGGVWIWEAHTGNEFHTLRGHTKGITDLAWRADSNLVATASEDGQVIFWEMNNGRQVRKFVAHNGGTLSIDYARNGEFVTSGRDRSAKIWSASFALKKQITGFNEMVVATAITHDAKRIFTADWNGKIEAWDATTFKKLGELSGNPPRIADRITKLIEEINQAPAATQAADETLAAAMQKVSQAQAAVTKIKANLAATTKKVATLKNERSKLDADFQSTNSKRTQLIAEREQRRKAVENAQSRVDEHKNRNSSVEAELQTATTEVQEAIATEEQLKAAASKAKALAQADVANNELQQKASTAATALSKHQTSLSSLRSNVAGAQSRLNEERSQLQAANSNVKAAQAAEAEIGNQLKTLDATRKTLSDRRKVLILELQAASQKLPTLQKALKPAQDRVVAINKTIATPKAAAEQAKKRETLLKADLKFWRAAEVNAQLLVAAEKRDTLKADQDEDTETLNGLSETSENARAELTKIESRRGELTKQLDQIAAELDELRSAIKKRAPSLEKADQETRALQKRLHKLSN